MKNLSQGDRDDPTNRTRIRAHISTYGTGRIIALMAQFLIIAVLSRIDAGLYLDYTLALAATLTATNLCSGWVRQAMLRDSESRNARHQHRPQGLIVLSHLMSGLASTALGALLLDPSPWSVYAALFLASASYAFGQYFVSFMQAALHPRGSVILESTRLVLTGLLPLFMSMLGARVTLTSVLLGAALANTLAVLPALMRSTSARRPSIQADLRFGMPVAVWLMLAAVLQYTDRWVLAIRVDPEIAAGYAISYDVLVRGTASIMAPLVLALHPIIMNAANQQGSILVESLIRRALKYQSGMAGVALLGGTIFAILGERLFPGALTDLPVVFALVISGVSWQVILIIHKPFELRRRTTLMALALALALIVNFASNWLFAPKLGPTFVAFMSTFTLLVYSLALAGFDRMTRRVA